MMSKQDFWKRKYGVETYNEASTIWFDGLLNYPLLPLDQWVKLELPYKAPDCPGIPSIAEIDKAMVENRLTLSAGLFDVCRIGNSVFKRDGSPTILQEAENLLFLEKHSQVRIPKVQAAFIHQEDETRKTYYLVMEFVEGINLTNEMYPSLSEDAQKQICSSLGDQIQLLRSVPAPGEGYFGRVHHQGFDPRINLLSTVEYNKMLGPYDSYDGFMSAMYDRAEWHRSMTNTRPDYLPKDLEFLSKFKPILNGTQDRKPYLAHLDLSFKNLIARPIKSEQGEVIDWEVTIIDWDSLGWYPTWMQFASVNQRLWVQKGLPEMQAKMRQQVFSRIEGADSCKEEADFLLDALMQLHYSLL